jgi:hypothetical protein
MPKMSQSKRQRLKRRRERLAAEQAQQDSVTVDANDPASNVRLGSGGDDDGKYGPTGYLPARTEAKMFERAVRNAWLEDDQAQRFETRTSENELTQRVSSVPGEASGLELASLELMKCLKSPNRRLKMIAIRALIQMETANQRDEQHAENLKIKQALLEQKGGHVDASIPTGVVLLERPCTSSEEWQQQVDFAAKEQTAQSKVVGEN